MSGPCIPTKPSTPTSSDNCLPEEPFIYDPQDRHGPALGALALPIVRIEGAKSFSDLTESELRIVPVAAGTITILLFGAAAEMFGFIPCLLAAILFAVAPLPVYYDRYFIHESLFCAATFGLILSGWRASQRCAPLARLRWQAHAPLSCWLARRRRSSTFSLSQPQPLSSGSRASTKPDKSRWVH